MATTIKSNKAIVLGRGIECYRKDGEEYWRLSSASQARAETMACYYHKNKSLFQRMGSLIVCSGGYAGLALNQTKPPEGISEGSKMAAYLHAQGLPGNFIEYEGESTSTFGNFEECLRKGFFANTEFSSDDPLLLVASRQQGKHRGVPIAGTAYNIPKGGVHVLSAERENLRTTAYEIIGGFATRLAIREAQVAPQDPDSLSQAAQIFESFTRNPASLISAAIVGAIIAPPSPV